MDCFLFTQVAKRQDGLLNYMLFLRLTPTFPNMFINVASPIVNVPYHTFLLGTSIGIIPAAYVTVKVLLISYFASFFLTLKFMMLIEYLFFWLLVLILNRTWLVSCNSYLIPQAGITLGELQSVKDLYDIHSIGTLFLIGLASVTPTLISKKKTS